jgi:3-phosphoshikimate 1-carboxyvinyltransferase
VIARRLALIGVGLIGGSLARALREAGAVGRIAGFDLDPEQTETALRLGFVDETAEDPAAAVAGADLVVIAVPVLAMDAVFDALLPSLAADAVVTDVGSTKGSVLAVARHRLGETYARFVAGHPIAGTEKGGALAARADLFRAHRVVLTPTAETDAGALRRVRGMWEAVGARVEVMDAAHHDEVFAATSHLPHVLAYTLVDLLESLETRRETFAYAAGGFRDFTRIAGSSPRMWHDVVRANRAALLPVLDQYLERLTALRGAIAEDRAAEVLESSSGAAGASASSRRDRNRSRSARVSGLRFELEGGGRLLGALRVPGDKSISHRAVMLSAIADGESIVEGFLEGEDCLATMQAFRAMGVAIDGPREGRLRIAGVGLHGLRAPAAPLDLGNSGTSMRLLSGLLAGQAFATTLVGDASLSRRPMRRVVDPLRSMGAAIEASAAGTAPLHIAPAPRGLRGIDFSSPVASAQVKSCLLFAGLYAQGETRVREPGVSRDHSERMLASLGVQLRLEPRQVTLIGGQRLRGTLLRVPADLSSAAFFLVGASIAPGSDLLLREVGMNPTRIGVIDILRRMGARIEVANARDFGGEPVADLRVRAAPLRAVDLGAEDVALAIDEFPALFVAAACAEGVTTIRGASELRVKESDRIATMVDGLRTLGVEVEDRPDGAVIRGRPSLDGGVVDAHGDHRVAMSFAMAALRATAPVEILDCDNVATSFPGFDRAASAAGLRLTTAISPPATTAG